MPPNFKLQVF
ncbi:hypothetical protein EYZ11_005287 [Aspergillus tanneri]|uniref:Uncharacterized protein n=1 Tax=Aspergillus tanneri TaxID=1220188 RepID=A0A4S3JKS8_9EURO|nr:hypothetical protein EYZ11_005287 [Aspergillus tanneri]